VLPEFCSRHCKRKKRGEVTALKKARPPRERFLRKAKKLGYGVADVSGLGELSKGGEFSGIGVLCGSGDSAGVGELSGFGVALGSGELSGAVFFWRAFSPEPEAADRLAAEDFLAGSRCTDTGFGENERVQPFVTTFTVCEVYPGLLTVTVTFSARRSFTNFAGVTPCSPEESLTSAPGGSLSTVSFAGPPPVMAQEVRTKNGRQKQHKFFIGMKTSERPRPGNSKI
jgi:hypothetical protein